MNKEMTAIQESKLNMFRTVETHIGDNAAIIADSPAFQTAFNKIKANNAAIQSAAQQRSASLTGIAADKSNLKQTLAKLAATIAGAVFAYAAAEKNQTLKQEMNISVSKLQRARDEELAPRCQMIHDRAETNLAALTDYGINAAQLKNLQTAINNYSAETMKPRQAVSTRKTTRANLAALFRENDDILKNQLDKLIELYRADHPDFVNTYFQTRIIVDPPTRARKAEDVVVKK